MSRERKGTWEPYTYTKRELRNEYCGWKACKREYIVQKSDTRYVYRDVVNHRTECCLGYRKNIIHEEIFTCDPICVPECVGGYCSAPGNCTCSQGFQHLTSNICGPICKPECLNGQCLEPGKCSCFEGYVKVNDSQCDPFCPDGCVNGECNMPNKCSCFHGYEIHPTNHSLCEPICEEACINARCINVNECECFEGYKKDPSKPNVCSPYCTLECINGECTAPDICICQEGYHLGNESWNNCLPDCNCTNGYCLEPNNCTCFSNYTLNEAGECEPICDECINATCTSPNVCECLDGYTEHNSTACVPECSNCNNGICTEPELCSCFSGYQWEDTSCEPICNFGCAGGICTSPNECSCDFENNKILENVCMPLCNNSLNYTDTSCLSIEQTEIDFSPDFSTAFMSVSLGINCSFLNLLNNTSNNNNSSYMTNNYSGLPIECSAVRSSLEPYHFLCLWKDTNSSYETINDDILSAVAFSGNISADKREDTPQITVLLPEHLMIKGGRCELCAHASTESLNNGNRISFQMLPCQSSKREKFSTERKDSSMTFIILGIIIGTVILIGILSIIILNQRKFHEYIVTRTEHSRHDEMTEEVMLHEEVNNLS